MAILAGQVPRNSSGATHRNFHGQVVRAKVDGEEDGCGDCGCTCCPVCLNEFYAISFNLGPYAYGITVSSDDGYNDCLFLNSGGYCPHCNTLVCNMPYPLAAELSYGKFGGTPNYASTSSFTSTSTSRSTSTSAITFGTTSTSTNSSTSTSTNTSTSTSISSSGTFYGVCDTQKGYSCTYAVALAFVVMDRALAPVCGGPAEGVGGMCVYGIYILPTPTTPSSSTSTGLQCGASPVGTYNLYCVGIAGSETGTGFPAGCDYGDQSFGPSFCGGDFSLDAWAAVFGTTSTSSISSTSTTTTPYVTTSTSTATGATASTTTTTPYTTTSTNTATSTSTTKTTSSSFMKCDGGMASPNLNCIGVFEQPNWMGYATYLAAMDILEAMPSTILVTPGGGIYGYATSTSTSTHTSKSSSESTTTLTSATTSSTSVSTSTSTSLSTSLSSSTSTYSSSASSTASCSACEGCSTSYVVTLNCNGGSTYTSTQTGPSASSTFTSTLNTQIVSILPETPIYRIPLGIHGCGWGPITAGASFSPGETYLWASVNHYYLTGTVICGNCEYFILMQSNTIGCPDSLSWSLVCYYPISAGTVPYGSSTSSSTITTTLRSTTSTTLGSSTSTSTTTLPYTTTSTTTGSTASTTSTGTSTSTQTGTSRTFTVSTSTNTTTTTSTTNSTSVSSSFAAGTFTLTSTQAITTSNPTSSSTSTQTNRQTVSYSTQCLQPPSVVPIIVPASSTSSSSSDCDCNIGGCASCPPTVHCVVHFVSGPNAGQPDISGTLYAVSGPPCGYAGNLVPYNGGLLPVSFYCNNSFLPFRQGTFDIDVETDQLDPLYDGCGGGDMLGNTPCAQCPPLNMAFTVTDVCGNVATVTLS